jgi:hypothetical protein
LEFSLIFFSKWLILKLHQRRPIKAEDLDVEVVEAVVEEVEEVVMVKVVEEVEDEVDVVVVLLVLLEAREAKMKKVLGSQVSYTLKKSTHFKSF